MKVILLFLFVVIVLYSCNSNGYKTDASGMKYKFFVMNEQARKPVQGDILLLSMSYSTENDSVLFDTRELNGQPFRMKIKPPTKNGGTIDDAFTMMHEGDSAQFIVDAERFFLETKGTEVPKFIKPGSTLTFNIKLVEVFSYEKYTEEIKNSQVMNAETEKSMLQSYLKDANIKVKPTESGLYYIEQVVGKGSTPKKGKKVVVHYTGTFISGEVFDSSLKRGEPFEFEFGANQVIPGMEEGVSKMRVGGKATIIIPSDLAYGKEQYKMIPPYSTLIFELELLNIK
jgi:FKBP-type peptidyl-prolyl cis-trans isomerase FkpA